MRAIALGFALVLVSGRALAQEVTQPPEAARQTVGLEAGLDNAIIARLTYAHRLDLGVLRDVRVYARSTMPVATPDLRDWSLDAGLRATVIAWGDLRIAFLVAPVMKSTSNDLFSAVGLGLGETMLFGYEGARWGLSGEIAYEELFTTHVRHSDLYRQVGHAGARDGWYAFSSTTAHGGLRGGARIGAFEIVARAGINTTGELHSVIPPFYATLGTTYGF